MMVPIGSFEVSLDLHTDDGIFVRFHGTDRWRSKALAVDEIRRLVVVKIPGRKVFSGQGMPWRYSGITYEVLELQTWPLNGEHTLARRLLEWSHWQAAQA